MKFTLIRSVAAISLALAAAAPASAQQTKVLFNSFIARGHFFNQEIVLPWLEEVSKATQGRVVFEVPPTSLAAPQAQYEGVVKGVFDAAYVNNSWIQHAVKLPIVAQLPYTVVSAEANSIALARTYDKYFAKVNEYKDVQVFGFYVGVGGDIVSAKNPIQAAADLKGIKTYSLPGPTVEILTAAGAAVVAAPAVRAYELISGGTVDAFAGISSFDFEQFKSMQYGKHVVRVPGGTTAPVFSFIMNKMKWESISPADRDTILRMAREPLAKRVGYIDRSVRESDARLASAGVKVAAPSPAFMAELQRLGQPVIDAWIKEANALGVDGKAALEYYKSEAAAVAKSLPTASK